MWPSSPEAVTPERRYDYNCFPFEFALDVILGFLEMDSREKKIRRRKQRPNTALQIGDIQFLKKE